MEEWCADNSIVRALRTYLTDIQIKNLKKVSKKTGFRHQSTSEELLMNIWKNSKRKNGDEKRWKERGSFVYFFLPLLFSFSLPATLVMSLILELT